MIVAVAGRAEKQRWWSPAPFSDSEPIAAGRAYAELALVFSAVFGAAIINAGLSLASRLHSMDGDSWAVYAPSAFNGIAVTGLTVTVVLLLCRRRGLSRAQLGFSIPHKANGDLAIGASLRIFVWANLAFVLGSLLTSALKTGSYPAGSPSAGYLLFGAVSSFHAGIVEELVALVFVVVTLQQARRPLWEIGIVALLLRGSYHIYYGPGVVGIFLWAGVFLWLYLRTRNVVPLMVAHVSWDLCLFLAQRWRAAGAVEVLLLLVLLIAAPITWASERAERKAVGRPDGSWPTQQFAPPSWQPDPSGQYVWRWWNGTHWTETTACPLPFAR